MQILAAKLRVVKQALKQWSKTSFGDIFEGVRCAEREVVDVETKYDLELTDQLRYELHHAEAWLRHALTIEEGFAGRKHE